MTPATRIRKSTTWLTVAAFALALYMLMAQLGRFPLLQPDEGRNAEVAREMHTEGHWLVPLLNGRPYLDKPAFFFRASAICFDLLGVSEGAARLPSALSGLAVLGLVWGFARKRLGPRVAALAVMVAATAPIFVAFSRLVIMDMMLAVFVVAAILAGAIAEEQEGRRRSAWLVAGAFASGLATLVKGPVGFILPLLVLAVWHLVERRPSAIRRMFGWLPMAVFWATTLPWFIGLTLQCPDFPHYGLVEESFKRFSTGSMKRTQPFYFYGPVTLGALFGWSILLPEATWRAWRSRSAWTRLDRLWIIWSLSLLVFFSLSKSKQPGYILTIAVPLGLLIARLFDAALTRPHGTAAALVRRGAGVLTGLILLVSLATCGLLVKPEWSDWVFRAATSSDRFAMPALGPLAFSLALSGLLGVAACLRGNTALAFVFLATVLPLQGTINFRALVAYAEQRSCIGLVRAMPKLSEGVDVATYECMPSGLPFYLNRPLYFIDANCAELGSNYILYSLRKSVTWPEPLVERKHMDAWLAKRTNSLFLVTQTRRRSELDLLARRYEAEVQILTPRYIGLLLENPASPK